MAIISPADFREASVAEYCFDIQLSAAEAEDPILAATIARKTTEFSTWVNDQFEPLPEIIVHDGTGTRQLYLRKRFTSVSQVRTLDAFGNYTTQTPDTYRLRSSLDPTGSVALREYDYLEIPLFRFLIGIQNLYGAGYFWPIDSGSVEVTGITGWTICPTDVKRAVALMTYDHIKPLRNDLRRVTRLHTADADFDYSLVGQTGVPEVDAIIGKYMREAVPAIG